jgi:hypothetical protein
MLANLGHDDIITDDVLKAIEVEIGGDGDLLDTRKNAEAIGKALDRSSPRAPQRGHHREIVSSTSMPSRW